MGRILVGSTYFFSCYSDFVSKDIDEVEIIETDEFKQARQITGKGRCLFSLRKHSSKKEYIQWALQSSVGMVIGKFLVPEFCEQIGFTIEDLLILQPLVDKLDDKHQYEKIIYNSYIKNNAFYLTDKQRLEAYNSYKESRGDQYGLLCNKGRNVN